MGKKKLNVALLSDGTGETALSVLKATLVQYHHEDQVTISKHRNIRTKEQIESIFKKSQDDKERTTLVVYTLIMPETRKHVEVFAKKYKISTVDLLGKLIDIFDRDLETKVKQAGILRLVNEDYFKRIEAMDFSLKHDDGQMTETLQDSDIILVGVSRTSKTPLSLFLSNKGWKVSNIPLVYNIPPPENLFTVDQRKIIALTINPEYLFKIRKNRLEKFGYDPGGSYADKDKVYREVTEIQSLFQKQKWPTINVTEKAIEETAEEIVRTISSRMKLPLKII